MGVCICYTWVRCMFIFTGNSVPLEEQVDVKTAAVEGEQPKEGAPPGATLTMATSFVGLAGGGASAISEAERLQLEEEKMKLYQQLDDKVSISLACSWP